MNYAVETYVRKEMLIIEPIRKVIDLPKALEEIVIFLQLVVLRVNQN